jgi:predicted metal-binding protein
MKRENEMKKVKKDFQERYVDKKFGEPKMNIMVFMACGEKEGRKVFSNRESYLDKDEL